MPGVWSLDEGVRAAAVSSCEYTRGDGDVG